MSTEIARFYSGAVITACSSAASTTPRIPYGRYSGGGVIIANTNGATQIRWYASAGAEDVPVQVYADGAVVATAVTTGAHPIPDACFGFGYIAPILVGSSSCSITVSVKG
jgi:hypothetical protein